MSYFCARCDVHVHGSDDHWCGREMQIAVHLLVANISTAALSFMQQGSEYGEGCALADVAEAEEHLAKVIAEHRAWREKQEKRLALAGDLAQRLLREIDAAAQGGER